MPPRAPGRKGGFKGTKQKAKKGTMKRLLSLLFSQNKKLLITA